MRVIDECQTRIQNIFILILRYAHCKFAMVLNWFVALIYHLWNGEWWNRSMQISWTSYHWHGHAWLIKLECEWGLGLIDEAWMWMGFGFEPWVASNDSWCYNIRTWELRSDGAQSFKTHHSILKCRRVL
jgi:hypothetical protein